MTLAQKIKKASKVEEFSLEYDAPTLDNARSREDVIDMINSGGTSLNNPDELAAIYCWNAAVDADKDRFPLFADFVAQLDLLLDDGATVERIEVKRTLEDMLIEQLES